MLKYNATDNAVFYGLEAEGVDRGMPTVFVVGDPPVAAILDGIDLCRSKAHGQLNRIYLGAGGVIDRSLSVASLETLLGICAVNNHTFYKLVVETVDIQMVRAYINTKSNSRRATNNSYFVDCIVPLRFDQYKMSKEKIAEFVMLERYVQSFLNTPKFVGKVYIPNQVCVLGSLASMCIAPDYDANEAEYAEDVEVWKG